MGVFRGGNGLRNFILWFKLTVDERSSDSYIGRDDLFPVFFQEKRDRLVILIIDCSRN